MPVVEELFHPAVSSWFTESLGEPTEPQEQAWPSIQKRQPTLIAAPTGSGKTLASFLAIIDKLVREAVENGGLPEQTRVVYVSPLKALSNDIEINLHQPLLGIQERLEAAGHAGVEIRSWVRTGDTPSSERTRMLKHPPHILVTTPESLYILLTSDGGRGMLQTTETVIVDEIHAMVGDKRGSHLAVTLERLERLVDGDLLRIGLSATQNPIEKVAEFLFGDEECNLVDLGHRRQLDLALELPQSPLEAVMSNEVWEEIYDRLAELILAHQTTLVFVNTRRLAERSAKHLSDRLGKGALTSHHGSLSRDQRLDAEKRLKAGDLRALVATASLELGIDIGGVDLVCQLGTTRTISTLLQRVGRSGHAVGGVSKGRLFPLSRDELVEAVALCAAIKAGHLDRLEIPERPLDILAQQIVACVACEDWDESELYETLTRAYPFRRLDRSDYDEIVAMLRDGFSTRNGRRGAYIHHDRVQNRLRGRRGARLAALTNGGAIPDSADYDVVLEPDEIRVGSVNEDFAIESLPGSIFQLGNTSWRIRKIEPGKLRVEDARGQPPNIPFWLGEAPSRSAELSAAMSTLRTAVTQRAAQTGIDDATAWLATTHGVAEAAARQLVDYLVAAHRALGVTPTQDTLVLERFFDDSGGMQLVLHSPYGSRLNRAWGLALRKRFCRKFNFELQAAATEDAIVLSLGVTHSFPLDEVFSYLHPDTVRDLLVQALLDAPMFNVRWRWNVSRALAVLRFRGGKRVPPQIQRMNADDLVSVVFPDQLACLENITGAREVPEHPLVEQTIRDCLEEAMDIDRLEALLTKIRSGEIRVITKELTEPSPLAQETLNAKPYAFLDDAPLEERRTQAVLSRRWLDPKQASDLGALDAAAIEAVKEEAFPQAETPDELHDSLALSGFLAAEEIESHPAAGDDWQGFLVDLGRQGRATHLSGAGPGVWVAAERLAQVEAVHPDWQRMPPIELPAVLEESWRENDALTEILRSRLEILGPVTTATLARPLDLGPTRVAAALARLEGEGFVIQGRFSPRATETEWCERRLLARVHRRTVRRLRAEIEPVSGEAFVRFLLRWQHVDGDECKAGPAGTEEVVRQLEGFGAPAGSWEIDLLPDRVDDYEAGWLDNLCLSGKFVWQRRTAPSARSDGAQATSKSGPIRSTPIALLSRAQLDVWRKLSGIDGGATQPSSRAADVLTFLTERGASFFEEIAHGTNLLHTEVEACLAELAALGQVTSDSFLGLRALLLPANRRKPVGAPSRVQRRTAAFGLEDAGRWVALPPVERQDDNVSPTWTEDELEAIAWVLLRRWGVLFRRVLDRESGLPPWRDLLRFLRRLEARGEIRGGRFVAGFAGEQFALPEAVSALRKCRRRPETDDWHAVSGADPLNVVGILTPGERVAAISSNRILYRNGKPSVVDNGGEEKQLEPFDDGEAWAARKRLDRRRPAAKPALAR